MPTLLRRDRPPHMNTVPPGPSSSSINPSVLLAVTVNDTAHAVALDLLVEFLDAHLLRPRSIVLIAMQFSAHRPTRARQHPAANRRSPEQGPLFPTRGLVSQGQPSQAGHACSSWREGSWPCLDSWPCLNWCAERPE